MAVDPKWVEAFGPVDTATPSTRMVSDLWDSLKERGSNIGAAWSNEGISVPEAAAHTAAQTAGGAIDVAAAPVSFLLDAVVPGTMGQEAISELMNTEAGKFVVQKWDTLSDEDKLRVKSGGVLLESLAAKMGFKGALKSVARNAWSLVPDFYAGNPFSQAAGIFYSFANKGISAGVRQAVSPSGQALLRDGVPQGLVDEVNGVSNALRMYDDVMAKKRSGKPLDAKESEVHKLIMAAGTNTKKTPGDKSLSSAVETSRDRTPASPNKLRSFLEGAAMTHLYQMKQQGMDTGVLETLVMNPHAANVSKLGDKEFFDGLGTDVPQGIKDRLYNHAKNIHGGEDGKTIVVNRSATSDTKLVNEAWGQAGTAQGRLQTAFSDTKKKGQLAKQGVEQFESAADFRTFIEASRLSSTDQAKYYQLKTQKAPLKTGQEKILGRLNGLLDEKGRIKVSEPDADGYQYFQDTHHSAAKELGGVNTMTAANWKTGETYGMITDGSDLLGQTPPGYDSLITFVEPIKWNMYAKDKKGSSERMGAPAQSTRTEAVQQTQAQTGVPQGPRLPGTTEWSSYLSDVMREYKPKPMLRDYVSAAGNQAKLGAATGLLAAHNQPEE